MDIQPQAAKPISDDQELAKVLAGVSKDADNLNFEEPPITPMPAPDPVSVPDSINNPAGSAPESPVLGYNPPIGMNNTVMPQSVQNADNNLEGIKKTALTELRPLVDKLNISAEEKFDIYLLLLRSTDDTTLIAPAHETAASIADESKRAQALLDVIKEIDYLSNPPQKNL